MQHQKDQKSKNDSSGPWIASSVDAGFLKTRLELVGRKRTLYFLARLLSVMNEIYVV